MSLELLPILSMAQGAPVGGRERRQARVQTREGFALGKGGLDGVVTYNVVQDRGLNGLWYPAHVTRKLFAVHDFHS
jgi:hypothetical protein